MREQIGHNATSRMANHVYALQARMFGDDGPNTFDLSRDGDRPYGDRPEVAIAE
jgi:hypothetical protein